MSCPVCEYGELNQKEQRWRIIIGVIALPVLLAPLIALALILEG